MWVTPVPIDAHLPKDLLVLKVYLRFSKSRLTSFSKARFTRVRVFLYIKQAALRRHQLLLFIFSYRASAGGPWTPRVFQSTAGIHRRFLAAGDRGGAFLDTKKAGCPPAAPALVHIQLFASAGGLWTPRVFSSIAKGAVSSFSWRPQRGIPGHEKIGGHLAPASIRNLKNNF